MTETEKLLRLFYAEFLEDPDTTAQDAVAAIKDLIKIVAKKIDEDLK